MEDRNNSTYKGYEIVRAWHPRPGDTRRMAWDVVCDGKVRRENIGSIETAKRLVDTMIKYGYWPDKTTIGTSNSTKGKGEQAMAKEGDLIRRSELRRQLVIWSEKLRAAGECGGCEVELLRAVIRMVDAQEAVDVEPYDAGGE